MKQFYYFSKNRLKFVEITNFYTKLIFFVVVLSFVISGILFGSYFVIRDVIFPNSELTKLQSENQNLHQKFADLFNKYKKTSTELDKIVKADNFLRLSVNLKPLTKDEQITGMGGKVFDKIPITNSKDLNSVLNNVDSYIDKVDGQLAFVKNNYAKIKKQFERNKKLYASIPAIKPVNGRYGDRFGMRFHPILKVRRMHNGIDIVANVGSKVYATGNGKVIFAGYKRTTGYTIEIDHGFGYRTNYFHLSKLKVRRGQKVKRGELIGLSGRTGTLCNGPHLHYEVRHDGIPLNPRKFIFDNVNLFDYVSQKNIKEKVQ